MADGRESETITKKILDLGIEQRGKPIEEVIDRLIHDIENDLQVISMEAHLRLPAMREPRGALDAVENIGRLLEKVRQYFLLPQ
jgi:hypothetical protein